MSQFSDLIDGEDGVYSITNRADLVAETALAVRQATLAAHSSDWFPRDRFELAFTLAPADAVWQLDIPTYFPQWRAFHYLRPYDALTGTRAKIIIGRNEFLQPDAIFDEYLVEKTNVAYVAGNNLNIKWETAYDGLVACYYKHPVMNPSDSYYSWIAEQRPGLIVLDAAMRVLDMIGYNDAARRLEVLLLGHEPGSTRANPRGGEYLQLKQDNLETVGG